MKNLISQLYEAYKQIYKSHNHLEVSLQSTKYKIALKIFKFSKVLLKEKLSRSSVSFTSLVPWWSENEMYKAV